MAKLSIFKVAFARPLVVACLTWSSFAQAAVNLDKLTACDDIARLYEFMKERQLTESSSCRPARSSLEKELIVRSGLDASQLCFDQSAPAPFLEGFSCISQEEKTGNVLVCFRSADGGDIRQYKAQYKEKFAPAGKKYLSEAAACRASNGDSVEASPTLFPPLLSLISRVEFGFITSLGKERPSDSSIVHGYATTDPSISNNAPSALEFVYVITNVPKYSSTSEQETIGNWLIHIDEDKELEEGYNREARKRRIPVMLDSTSYKLERSTTASVSQGAKLALAEGLQRVLAKSLEDEGFESISDDELQAKTGMSTTEMIKEITKRMPFGTRQNLPLRLGPTLLILSNERRPKCTKDRAGGAMAVYLMAIQPVPEVTSDFGSVGLMIAGLGECARTTTKSTRTYINGLIDESTSQLLTALRLK
jgi:hypothetical protein